MEDSFSILLKALQSVFHLETMRNGKYAFSVIQDLKEAMDRYNPEAKYTFIQLLRAVQESLPHIEKWRINFDSVKRPMDELAKRHQMPRIDWGMALSHPKVSHRFQFSALNHAKPEVDLISWLGAKIGKPFTQLNPSEIVRILIDNKDRHGFYPKLGAYLEKKPDFLFHLIFDSEKNFIKICHTRIILYLTDQQIAKAIIRHINAFVHKDVEPLEQVKQVIHTLNDILSNGRSVSTLLRNAEAKPILSNSIFFQVYQSEVYATHQERSSHIDADKFDLFKHSGGRG